MQTRGKLLENRETTLVIAVRNVSQSDSNCLDRKFPERMGFLLVEVQTEGIFVSIAKKLNTQRWHEIDETPWYMLFDVENGRLQT